MVLEEPRSIPQMTGLESGMAGACSGFITRFLIQPFDVVKVRFQLQFGQKSLSKYRSIPQAIALIYKEEGLPALWKGHVSGQYLSVIFSSAQFATYEKVSQYFKQYNPSPQANVQHLLNLASGGLAGVAATVVSFPFDIIRTRMIYQSEPKIYKGTIDAARQIYKREGIHGFKKGLSAACFQTAPTSGLLFGFRGLFTNCWIFFFHFGEENSQLSTTGSLVTGLLAGLCSKTIVYPFDLVKKRLQIQGFDEGKSSSKHAFKCRGIMQCIVLTIKHEGFSGLFKGFTPSLLKAGASGSIYFTVYEKVCRI